MICPLCGKKQYRVIETRKMYKPEGLMIRRRRECRNCGKLITTYEMDQEAYELIQSQRIELDMIRGVLAKNAEPIMKDGV